MQIRRLSLAVALCAAGCNPTLNDNKSAVTLHAAFGEGPGDVGAIGFFSDVVSATGASVDESYDVFVESVSKNPDADLSPLYTVDFSSYVVSFTRPDGRNEPGVDVPFPFTLALGGSIEAEGDAQLTLLFVTEEMKRNPPLRNLFFSQNQRIYTTIHVTIYGQDRVNHNVSASASAPVIFGDFAG